MTSENKVKIMLAITKSNWGGAQKYVFDLANGLDSKHFDVCTLLGGHGILKDKLEKTEIRTIFLPQLGRDIKFWDDLKSFWHIYKILQTERPEVLHLNSSKMLVLGALAGKLAGIEHIIYTAHGWAFNEDRSQLSKNVLKLIYRFAFFFVNKIIFVSEQTKLQALANGFKFDDDQAKVIHNGLKKETLLEKNEAREVILSHVHPHSLAELISNPKNIWVGTIAELHNNKGLSYAIQAIKELPENIHYFIIGGGEERVNLEKLINALNLTKRVHLLGRSEEHI